MVDKRLLGYLKIQRKFDELVEVCVLQLPNAVFGCHFAGSGLQRGAVFKIEAFRLHCPSNYTSLKTTFRNATPN
jgi:hypothetical protein